MARKPRKRAARGGGGKHSYVKPVWRFGDLVTGLGHDAYIVEKLARRGYPRVPVNSVTGWRLRNSIPSFWVPVFLQMGIEEKLIKNIEDLRVQT
jgi:hypothetical protein